MARPVGSKNKSNRDMTKLAAFQENMGIATNPIPVVDSPVDNNSTRGTIEKVRKISTNKDHKGEGEPLCHGCGHRSDMHYLEHRWTEQKMAKNLQGDIGMIEVQRREPIFSGDRPCQHACLCKAYE